jgi:hypothetical protein
LIEFQSIILDEDFNIPWRFPPNRRGLIESIRPEKSAAHHASRMSGHRIDLPKFHHASPFETAEE